MAENIYEESSQETVIQLEATGPPIIIYNGAAGQASQVLISPPIPGLSATSVYAAIVKLSDESESSFPFSFGDASPLTILVAKANQLVRTVTISILTPFNGGNPLLSVGDAVNAERLFPSTSVDPTDANTEWEYNPSYRYGASTPILLSITPDGSTQGSGFIYIKRS
jgi:hypothetical protein